MFAIRRQVEFGHAHERLSGQLDLPESARALVIVGQLGRHPAFGAVAATLASRRFGILAIDLLTAQEAHFDSGTHNVARLAQRLLATLDFLKRDGDTGALKFGIFAADSVAAAAIRAAAQRDADVLAVVVRDGLIDHAGLQYLEALAAPLLVLVDEHDTEGEAAARRALQHVTAPHELRRVASVGVASAAASWFGDWLR